jgi:carbon storage regulator
MLVLSRKANESIIIGHDIKVEILEIRGNVVRLGIKAPREVSVVRVELCDKLATDELKRGNPASPQSVSRMSMLNLSVKS